LMRPDDDVFRDPSWGDAVDYRAELAPHYETARRMLGVTLNPALEEGEETLRRVSARMGAEASFHPTEVGVYFGQAGITARDPYFSGAGPERTGCVLCGGCMVGCRFGAKNTLDKNYLYFAERFGARVIPETKVVRIVPVDGGYEVETRSTTA